MYKFFLTVLLFIVSTQVQAFDAAAGKVTGKVMDAVSKQPIEYATITVLNKSTKNVVNGTITDGTGSFVIKGLAPGNYIFKIQSLGYQEYTINTVSVQKNASINLPVIALVKQENVLQGVTVTAKKPLVENKIDKMVFNAEKDLTSQSGVATDLLKKVPMVSVDVDGNVQLAGSSSIQFLINGRPSTAFGNNIADVLQAIPASQIKSIEVITNPGAKYDASGLGGIINIILKDNHAKGINGNLSLTAGTLLQNGSFNLTARKKNFGINAFVSGGARLRSTTPNTVDRVSMDTLNKTNVALLQSGTSRFTRHGMQSGIGFDWTLDSMNNISGGVNYNLFGYAGSGFVNQTQTTTDIMNGGNVLSDIASFSNSNGGFHFHNIDANLNYKKTFAKPDQELDISLNSSFGHNHGYSNSEQFLVPSDSKFFGTQNDNPGTNNVHVLTVDYTQPITSKIKFGTGGRVTLTDINSTASILSLNNNTGNYYFDSTQSNHLNYHQQVYAVYSELSFPVGTLFDAKVGGRYERTEINDYYSNAISQVKTPGYNTFVPSVYFIRKLTGNSTLKISYSKRIERPSYQDLNPFVNTSDPKNISTGNPYLQPQIGNRYELSYNKQINNIGSFMIAAFYRTSNHDIQPYVVFYPDYTVGDSVFTNVSVSTRQNIGLEKNIGINLFSSIDVSNALNLRTNMFFYERNTINALDPGYNSNSFNYHINLNASYQFKHDVAAEVFGNFRSARNEVQGRYPSFTTYSFAVRKQFWNKKGSLALTAVNVFSQYLDQRTVLTGPNFTTNNLRQIPFRSIGLNFTWKFGKLEFKKDDNTKPDSGGNGLDNG
ncbi:TonB-dependent receptor domain-containing protein [Hydrotalea lipotrueae]|uniref:TonB-dependent receptor domain-containing protein n=1 Tax=Hydrotalea lipotrueae TaxID=2803817 RepID=UPI001E293477|nr:TonB-dependent receptor [Hydrotalea lipotrueae]